MKAVIELLCHAHPIADRRGPLITPIDGMWAYCDGHASDGHEWTRIQPTRRDHLANLSQMKERRAS